MHHILSYSDMCVSEGIFDLRIYVAVTSSYPRDQGVTGAACPCAPIGSTVSTFTSDTEVTFHT